MSVSDKVIKIQWLDAIRSNDISKVQDLYEKHREELVQVKDSNDKSGLHYACQYGRTEIVQFLVERGADGLDLDIWHVRPIHYAIRRGHLPIVQYLHEQNCGFYPIPICMVGLNPRHRNGAAEVHFATQAIIRGHIQMLKYFVTNGVEVPAKGLYYACGIDRSGRFSNLPIVRYLFTGMEDDDEEVADGENNRRGKKGKHIDTFSCFQFDSMEGVNALRIACYNKNHEIAKYLVEHGVDVNRLGDYTLEFAVSQQIRNTYSTLALACCEPKRYRSTVNLETVKLLVNHSADIHAGQPSRNLALEAACSCGFYQHGLLEPRSELIRYLIDNGASVTSTTIFRTMQINDLKVIKFLAEELAVPDICGVKDYDNHGRTILHMACQRGH